MIDAWIGAAGGINLAARAGLSRDVHVLSFPGSAWECSPGRSSGPSLDA